MAAKRNIERLYGLPLRDFTSARNALVRELRKAGRKDEAEEVRALKKPSASAWAINQLARAHPTKVAELVKAGDALRKAQRDVLAGKRGADVRDARRAQGLLVDDLVAEARESLAASAGKATPSVAQRISTTLRAASTDPAAAKLLRQGCLTEDVESVGFGPLLHVAPKRRTSPDVKRTPAKTDVNRKKATEAQASVRREREALRNAEREAAAARKAAAQAERAARRAAARLKAAERKAAATGRRR